MSDNSYLRDFSAQGWQHRFLSLVERFTAYYNCMTWNKTKTHISAISVHRYHKFFSKLIWPLYSLLQQYELRYEKTRFSEVSVHKYHNLFF